LLTVVDRQIEPSGLICAADLSDTATPSTSTELQAAQSIAHVAVQSQLAPIQQTQSHSRIPIHNPDPIPYYPSNIGGGGTATRPIPYQAPPPADVDAQLAYATVDKYGKRSTASLSTNALYPYAYNDTLSYAPIQNQNNYVPPHINDTNAWANYTTSQHSYVQSSSSYYNPPPYESLRTSLSAHTTSQMYNLPYTSSYPDQPTSVSSSKGQGQGQQRPPSSSSTSSYASHFSPGKHPSYPFGQDTGVVGVFRPKHPRERADSEDSGGGGGGGGDVHRSKRAAKVIDKRGLFGSLHVQAVKVLSPEGDLGMYFLFTVSLDSPSNSSVMANEKRKDLMVRNEGS
jgi:hypothetical protein